ncbi:MAG: NUDIX hydrolase [Candidatus Omnitrophota bacterium]|nr:NUDIX hydrolase [Candidatus Omnitrophota bacterium]
MKILKPIARTIIYDGTTNKVLLVRNTGAAFWYAPGGEWEFKRENILECAKREVFEETGLRIDIQRLLYVQEFHGSEKMVCIEMFWLARLSHEQDLDLQHVDLDPNGSVEETRWFSKEELQELKVFPERLRYTFWDNIQNFEVSEDPFIGIS